RRSPRRQGEAERVLPEARRRAEKEVLRLDGLHLFRRPGPRTPDPTLPLPQDRPVQRRAGVPPLRISNGFRGQPPHPGSDPGPGSDPEVSVTGETLLRLALVPAAVWLASLAARRWGHAVSGYLGGLPFIAGPITFYLALDYGTEFAARSAMFT